MVYPKIPVPSNRPSDPGPPRVKGFGGGANKERRKWIIGIAIAAVLGGIIGFVAHPSHADEADKAKAEAVAAQKAAATQKDRADGLDKQLTEVQKAKESADKQVESLSGKAADVDKKAADLAAEEKKLQATIDKSQGSVDTEGGEIHLKLFDKVLFAVGDDKLTAAGKAALDKVAVALKNLPDKQVWVQGHTDDEPIYVPPPKPEPKGAKKPAKGKEPAGPEPIRFITNWELSAARALTVVHYLQDVAKLDPTRLAALAFGQYHPVSRSNKAANRRIEIVLVPKREILEKAKK